MPSVPSPAAPAGPGRPGPAPGCTPGELLRLIAEQEHLLLAVAGGLPRDGDLDREYWVRGRTIRHELALLGLPDPLPYRDLAAWVAECILRLPEPEARRARVTALLAPVRSSLLGRAGR